MPPHRSGRRRRRHELSRPPLLEEEDVTEHTSSRAHGPIDTPGSLCAEDQAASVQKPQAASSIVATSLSRQKLPGTIWSRLEWDWGYTFYIKIDRQGSFHTYPGLDGPYRSLQEADDAIDCHLDKLRDPEIFMMRDGETSWDVGIRQQVYWPDGTNKRSRTCGMKRMNDQMRRLAQALVDKYNEDHHLSGDLAYELKDVLSHNPISEHNSSYHHINFSANSKATSDSDSSTSDMFFAEVKYVKSQGKHSEVLVCCVRRVDPVGKGQQCNACSIIGCDIMHPRSFPLAAGSLDPRCQFGGPMDIREWNHSEDPIEQEKQLRKLYEGINDSDFIASLFKPPPGVTGVFNARG